MNLSCYQSLHRKEEIDPEAQDRGIERIPPLSSSQLQLAEPGWPTPSSIGCWSSNEMQKKPGPPPVLAFFRHGSPSRSPRSRPFPRERCPQWTGCRSPRNGLPCRQRSCRSLPHGMLFRLPSYGCLPPPSKARKGPGCNRGWNEPSPSIRFQALFIPMHSRI